METLVKRVRAQSHNGVSGLGFRVRIQARGGFSFVRVEDLPLPRNDTRKVEETESMCVRFRTPGHKPLGFRVYTGFYRVRIGRYRGCRDNRKEHGGYYLGFRVRG